MTAPRAVALLIAAAAVNAFFIARSKWLKGGRHAEPDHVDPRRALGLGTVVLTLRVGIRQAAQGELDSSLLTRLGEPFGLVRRELQRRGLADDDALPVLFLDGLIDGEDPDVDENDLDRKSVV